MGSGTYASPVATSTRRELAREQIVRLCRTELPVRAFRAAVLEQLRLAIDFDSYVFVLTDPQTCVGSDPLADVPMLGDLPRLIRLKYATSVNRWTTLDDPPVASLCEVTGGCPEQSLLWRDMLAAAGIVDVASIVFRDRFGCWGFLDLWRSGHRSPFVRGDADFLATIVPAVTTALRRGQAATFSPRPGGMANRDALVLLLSPDLTIRAQTQQTDEYLRRLLPTPPEMFPIPAAVYNVAAQLVAVEAGVDDHPPAASVHLGDGIWVTLRAARIGDGRPGDIAVTLDSASPTERMELFSRSCALTARESELLAVLADGADTRHAAAQLYLSAHTVQDHLKSIFDKTGTRSRRELLARALG